MLTVLPKGFETRDTTMDRYAEGIDTVYNGER